MNTPRQLKTLYEQGKNISELLRHEKGIQYNTNEIIEMAYDLQAGSYIASMNDAETATQKKNYASEIAKTIV
ncbi:MAG: methyltransferase type 11, partial [Candidatus Electrothrix sp. AUS1_2]|nr:methyltransferase type 11 [Candidatus Electrothrix sp. AUS1_2]